MTPAEQKVIDITKYLESLGFHYGLGDKIDPLSAMPPSQRAVDCSGFVRYVWYHVSKQLHGSPTTIPDGSVQQDDYFASANVKYHNLSECPTEQLIVGFLPPGRSSDGVGHAFFICSDGYTCESHGSKGPDRRDITTLPWLDLCVFYTPLPVS